MKNLILPFILLFTFNSLALSKEPLDLNISDSDIVTSADEEMPHSNCLDDYRRWRNNAAIASGLTPFVGIAGVTGSVLVGLNWDLGGWYAFQKAIGETGRKIVEVAINVIPMGLVAGTIIIQTAMIKRFVKASKSYRLIRNLYTNENDRLLQKLTRKVQRKRPDITSNDIYNALIEADANGKLCDGSMVSRFVILRTKYNKRLATMKDMKRWLIRNL